MSKDDIFLVSPLLDNCPSNEIVFGDNYKYLCNIETGQLIVEKLYGGNSTDAERFIVLRDERAFIRPAYADEFPAGDLTTVNLVLVTRSRHTHNYNVAPFLFYSGQPFIFETDNTTSQALDFVAAINPRIAYEAQKLLVFPKDFDGPLKHFDHVVLRDPKPRPTKHRAVRK